MRGFRHRLVLAVALLAASPVAWPQVNNPAYASYFLVGQFGEVCTMCEVMVLCEDGAAPVERTAVPAGGDFTLYHIHTRTFWSQVSTIWEWFVSNFSSRGLVAGHARPATVHAVSGGTWAAPQAVEVQVSLEPALLRFTDGREIDRTNRRWQASSSGQPLGYCTRLPLWEAIDVIGQQGPGEVAP